MKLKKLLYTTIISLTAFSFSAQTKADIENGTILHAWCWSFKTIEQNMDKIADAGYTAVQTSPANTCLEGDYGGLEFMSQDLSGKWYFHYQPTDWKIGNYQLGTRDDFIAMCKAAKEHGIAVIVDVLPNHTTPRIKSLAPEFVEAVGGIEKMYHKGNDHDLRNFSNRMEMVNYKMGGLPDVNTENPKFQSYYMDYVNDVIDCGASGFRYDTAKHIALPDDPKDEYSTQNDFWPIFTGKKSINGKTLHNAENLFIYGEVLQGGAAREDAYAQIMSVTASNYGGIIRSALKNTKFQADKIADWRHPASKDRLVTWVESHDTYANQGESAWLTNAKIRLGWAVIAARDGGTPLFFSRPQGQEAVQFPGASKIGDIGSSEFMNSEVVAVNHFRKEMQGLPETLENGTTNATLIIKRGDKGLVIINSSEKKKEKVSVNVALPDGEYKDKAHGTKFKVKDGVLKGTLKKESIAVIY